MSEARADFCRKVALIATMHGKEAAFAAPLEGLGFTVETADGFDTDRFGTFSGDVEREGDMLDAARAKARAAFLHGGGPADWVVASEGAFGPSRAVPVLAEAKELALAWRPADDLEVVVSRVSFETNFACLEVAPDEDLDGLLSRVGFPQHALTLRTGGEIIVKALTSRVELDRLIAKTSAPIQLETDMRAHLNPTRMDELSRLAETLAARLATPCPKCAAPGFGRSGVKTGLPCALCGAPTDLVAREIWSCGACGHEECRARADKRAGADPGECPVCNP